MTDTAPRTGELRWPGAAVPAGASSLANQVVLVTGGARGLGAALCSVLAAEGALVLAADRDIKQARQTVANIQASGALAQALELDVGEPAQVEAAVHALLEDHGRLDILINNAAIDVTAPIDELSVADWMRELQTNLTGPFVLAKCAAAHMRLQGRGQIVNIASTASLRAWPNASAYHASKWGLRGLSHALHAELRGAGIRVSTVIAGGMRTPFLLERFPAIDRTTLQDPVSVALAVRFVLTQPEGSVIAEIMVLPTGETSWP